MRTITSWILLSAVAAALASGCGGPVVPIRHALPAAVPLPGGVQRLTPGAFSVTGVAPGSFSADLAKKLTEGLAADWPKTGQAANVGGEIRVKVNDASGKRSIRRYSPKTKAFETVRVDSLVRTVDLRVDFAVSEPPGKPIVVVEVRRNYNSLADPRVRGETALERPDDAARVPGVDVIVRELLADAAESFCGMIRPMSVSAKVKMRGVGGKDTAAGFDAIEAKEYATALRHLRAAATIAPKNMRAAFNRGAAAEAAGELSEGLKAYRAVVEADKNDASAAECAERVRRVMLHLKPKGR